MRIGLLGGTFDPVHLGHLIGAQSAAEQLGLDQVLFVPAANPPHKLTKPITAALHRVAMLRKAIANNKRFGLYLDEIHREGNSYTIDTLRRFRKNNLGPEDELYFILGADNLVELNTWKQWRAICREARIAALVREGFLPEELPLQGKLKEIQVIWVKMPLIGISATGIRTACAAGKSIRYLVPDPVAEYIETHRLYRNTPGVDFSLGSG